MGFSSGNILWDFLVQMVMPQKFRTSVLQTADNNVAGHKGVKKTYNRVLQPFFWPRLKRDVAGYIKMSHQ